jgi:hypothetical protein
VYLQETGAAVGVCVATRNALVTKFGTCEPAKIDNRYLAYSSGLTVVIPASTRCSATSTLPLEVGFRPNVVLVLPARS